MNTVLSLIVLILQNDLKVDANYILATYFLRNANVLEDKNIQTIAQECHVSTNTVLRFCQLLGFPTFKNFKTSFISTTNTRKKQLKEKNEKALSFISEESQLFHDHKFSFIEKQLEPIIKCIKELKIVHLYGATYPLALAQSFIEDMATLGIIVYIHQLNYEAKELQDRDGLNIIITYSGRFIEVNQDEYKQIRSQKNPVALISKINHQLQDIDYQVILPQIPISYLDDIITMMIYDYITIKCSEDL
ncbi:MAG: hypothetical protein RR630_07150 [Coprobacillus sp.]